MTPPGGWQEWSKYVLKELERHSVLLEKIRDDITNLKIKAGLWGALGGVLPALALAIMWLLSRLAS